MSKNEFIQIRVSEDEKIKIKIAARKMGLTISEYEIKTGNLGGNLGGNF